VIPFVAAVVALLCAAASARRVWFAANATGLDLEDVDLAIAKAPDKAIALEKLKTLVAKEPSAEWEKELLVALEAPAKTRIALVNEQLTELDYRIQRWSRVPRVCASIATSFAFLLASLVLRRGLVDAGDLPSDTGELLVRGLVGDAFTVAAMGMIGTAFCIAAASEARKIAKRRMAAADKLVERLESIVERSGAFEPSVADRSSADSSPASPRPGHVEPIADRSNQRSENGDGDSDDKSAEGSG